MDRTDSFHLHGAFLNGVRGREIDLAAGAGNDHRVRQKLPSEIGSGMIELASPARGIAYCRYTCKSAFEEYRSRVAPFSEHFTVTVHLNRGNGEVGIEGLSRPITLRYLDSYIIGPSLTGTQVVRPGLDADEAVFFVDRELIESCLSETLSASSETLAKCLTAPGGEPLLIPGRAGAAMELAVRQMLSCGVSGSLARLYLEAKILEIVALRLSQPGSPQSSSRRFLLLRRDRELLEEARFLLLQRYADPPTISGLAREIGMNTTKLKAGFKELYGTTIFGFVQALRLQAALQLIRDGDCTVTEAATAVGYHSLSAFTTAFSSEYGFSPRYAKHHGNRRE